jgi:EAL domain-containing protein (putative c-di-GMP-specific phosphodiesterase class I)
VLRETGLEPSAVRLELTETVLVENAEVAAQTLAHLQEMGIRLCLDDFGTGYSSLGYLDRFPIHTVKIDRSFISQMRDQHKAPEIIRAIVALAKKLSIDVVAEGVESQQMLEKTRALRCEFAQGNIISEPMDYESIVSLLATGETASPDRLAPAPRPSQQESAGGAGNPVL